MTDGELLQRFVARGDASAFESLVLRHGPMVLRICRDVLNDPHDADDAFQAAFLVLVRNAHSIRDGDSLGRWLHEVTTRIALRSRAQAARRRAHERQGVEMAAAVSGNDAERRDLRTVVHAEIQRLPEKLRAPIILCYLEGRSYEDAAGTLCCPLGTLKGRLARGRDLLRRRLERRKLAVSLTLLILLLSRRSEGAVPSDLVDATVDAARRVAGGEAVAGATSARVARLVRSEGLTLPKPGWRPAATALLTLLVAGLSINIARQAGAARLLVPRAIRTGPPGTSLGTCAVTAAPFGTPDASFADESSPPDSLVLGTKGRATLKTTSRPKR